jgi:hypothetical protein
MFTGKRLGQADLPWEQDDSGGALLFAYVERLAAENGHRSSQVTPYCHELQAAHLTFTWHPHFRTVEFECSKFECPDVVRSSCTTCTAS